MAIDGSIIQFRGELNSNAKVYPLTYQDAVLGEDNQPLNTYITEYNVSEHHLNKIGDASSNPNYGTGIFTLEQAIATVPEKYRRGGLKLTFNSDSGMSTYALDESNWSNDASYWKQFDDNRISRLEQKVMTSKCTLSEDEYDRLKEEGKISDDTYYFIYEEE